MYGYHTNAFVKLGTNSKKLCKFQIDLTKRRVPKNVVKIVSPQYEKYIKTPPNRSRRFLK